MAMEIEQADSVEGTGGNFIDKIGFYHLLVTEVDDNPAKENGDPINGTQVVFAVLDGVHPDQKDKTCQVTFWNPEEKNDMASKRLTAFCLATCLIGAHIPGGKAVVEPKDAVGRQVVAKMGWKRKKNEATGKYEDTNRVDIAYSDIWHVDDTNVAKNKVPLDKAALAAIPSALRKPLTQPSGSTTTKPADLVTGTRKAPAVNLADV